MDCVYSHDIPKLWKAEGISRYKIPSKERLQHLDTIITEDNQNKERSIPNVFHQIWVTSSESPQEVPSKELGLTIDSFYKMQSVDPSFKSIFWTNNPSLIPTTIKSLQEAEVEVKSISDFGDLSDKNFELDSLIKAKKYGMASDIFRYLVVERDGGVYRDVDYELMNPETLSRIIKSTDFFAGYFLEALLGNAFFGAIPEHSIMQDAVFLVNRNFGKNSPEYQDKACNPYSETIMQTGPVVFDIAVYNRFQNDNIHTEDVVFSQGILYDFCQSHLLTWKNNTGVSCRNESEADIDLIGQIGNDNLSASWVLESALVPFETYKNIKETYHNQPLAQSLGIPGIKVNSTNLSFFFYQIADCNIKDVIEILKDNSHVTSLNLPIQQISSVGAIELADFLKTSNITDINLGGNNMGSDGAKTLAKFISTHQSISSVRLWGNNIGDDGAIALADAVYNHPSLAHLDITYNNIGILGISALISNIHRDNNITFELWGNKITAQELEYLYDTNQCLL